ncbi:MAG: SDR family NAD(P)-dependent oxidoreductase [Bacteroidales bacterium]|nr:SDR family NAD(P)-dependent oxidoreductase [Bacteroidales bacterium]MCF8402552.1 SDR family NAD(P)-dependent oxidoreductase [Bacteroidales bacterium]
MTLDLKNANILITGGSGQIGSHLVEALLQEEAKITVLGRDPKNLKELLPLYKNNEIKFVRCDLSDQKSIQSIGNTLSYIKYVVHFASDMSPSINSIEEEAKFIARLNLIGIIELLGLLKNLKGICFSSSMAVYGNPEYIPVDELCPHKPNSFYGSAKSGSELFLKLFSNRMAIPLTILRYASVYGPRNRTGRSIPLFIKSALKNKQINLIGEGKGYRDFVYISDAIDATLNAIKLNEDSEYNIGSGTPCSMLDLANTIIKLTNSQSEIGYIDKPNNFNFLFDIEKAKKILKYQPETDLEKGLKMEIDWHIQENK